MACEVIMVCAKRWVVDCGVCGLIDYISLLCIPMYFTILIVSDGTAGYTNVGGPIHT